MAKKVQSQLLVSEVTRDRADALALVRDEPRAEIYRLAIEGNGLQGLEDQMKTQLMILDSVAEAMGLSRLELARRAVADRYRMSDLEGRKRYPRKA